MYSVAEPGPTIIHLDAHWLRGLIPQLPPDWQLACERWISRVSSLPEDSLTGTEGRKLHSVIRRVYKTAYQLPTRFFLMSCSNCT